MVRCLLVDSGFPPELPRELMLTAVYLCNRMPHSGLDMETPFKRLYGKEANLSHLKIVGARAFVHIKDAKKLEPKSWEGMLCGFSDDEELSYRIWNPKTRRVVESRNVAFIETPPHLILQPTRLSPLRELPPAESVDDYTPTNDMLRIVRDYTAILDFNVNIPRGSTIGEGGDTTISSPGRLPKQYLPGIGLHDSLHGREACPEFIAFDQGNGKKMSLEGYFCAGPSQNGDKFVTSPPPTPIVERVFRSNTLMPKVWETALE